MKIKCWVDNNANVKSCKTFYIDVDEEEWENMNDSEKTDLVYEQALQFITTGWEESK